MLLLLSQTGPHSVSQVQACCSGQAALSGQHLSRPSQHHHCLQLRMHLLPLPAQLPLPRVFA